MGTQRFDKPVRIRFGKPGKTFLVTSVGEARNCLRSDKWPARPGPKQRFAHESLLAAMAGTATPVEARCAFVDAASEARILAM